MSGVNEWLISLSEYIGGISDELDNANAENVKLRELCADMKECLEHSKPFCKKCKFQELGCQWFNFDDRMRELGVEVDE